MLGLYRVYVDCLATSHTYPLFVRKLSETIDTQHAYIYTRAFFHETQMLAHACT